MDISIIAMTVIGISTSLISFLLGTIYGRNTAYKAVRTLQTADTQNMFKISPGQAMADRYRAFRSGFKHGSKKYQTDQ